MLRNAERGCLVIADISGYTQLLVGSELEHAQDALRDLTTTVVTALRPRFRLAKLEGDAAFVYAVGEHQDGSQLLDTIDAAYFAFRRRLDAIARATTCECNACTRLPALNLKLIAHYGSFVRERQFGTDELTGSDVIVVHRLLKNSVDATRLVAYALLTDACVRATGLDPEALGLIEHRETYDQIGEVRAWLQDMEARWRHEIETRRHRVTPRQTWATLTGDVPVPPPVAWEYLTSPAHRARFIPGVQRIEEVPAAGRRGAGTRNHCVHGDGATLEEFLDWRPFSYFTLDSRIPGLVHFVGTTELAESDGGTHITVRLKPKTARDRATLDQIGSELLSIYEASLRGLQELVASEVATQEETIATSPA
jgi:carbon monoxide dehydrogenase subunit G